MQSSRFNRLVEDGVHRCVSSELQFGALREVVVAHERQGTLSRKACREKQPAQKQACLKKNMNASRLSGHSPVRGGKMSKR